MKKLAIFAFILISVGFVSHTPPPKKKIEIALCFDFSGSTDGLYKAARENLNYLLYQLINYEPSPEIDISIIGYGRPKYKNENNYIKIITELGKDVDAALLDLYDIKGNIKSSGTYHGLALRTAVESLDWSTDKSVMKSIVLIGNGDINFEDFEEIIPAIKTAREKDIVVNTIYFQSYYDKDEIKEWDDIAKLGFGQSKTILPNDARPWERHLISTKGKIVADVSKKLNKTYLPYGEKGKMRYQEFLSLDAKAVEIGPICSEYRLIYKLSDQYHGINADWDLVDLSAEGVIDYGDLDRQYLPDYLKNMNAIDIEAYVSSKRDERIFLKEIAQALANDNIQQTRQHFEQDDPVDRNSLYKVLTSIFDTQARKFQFKTNDI